MVDELIFIESKRIVTNISTSFIEKNIEVLVEFLKRKFDQFNEGLSFSQKSVKVFTQNYIEIVDKHKNKNYTNDEKNSRDLEGVRYVEFNLTYDRGTLFGLQSEEGLNQF